MTSNIRGKMRTYYRRLATRMPITLGLSVCCISVVSSAASGAVTHRFLGSELAGINTGKAIVGQREFDEVNAIAVDDGDLFVAENYGSGSRTDEFNPETLEFIGQFPQPSPEVKELNEGLAIGSVEGQRQAFLSSRSGKIVVYGERPTPGEWVELGEWDGGDSPQRSLGGVVGGVAFDASRNLSDWARGDLIVANSGQHTLDVFKPKANGGEEFITQLTGDSNGSFSELRRVAVNQENGDIALVNKLPSSLFNIEILEPEAPNSYKLIDTITTKPNGAKIESRGIGGIAFDDSGGLGTGGLYLANGEGAVYEYSPGGAPRYTIEGQDTEAGSFRGTKGIAIDPSTGNVFVGDQRESPSVAPSVVDEFGEFEIIPDVRNGSAGSATFDKGSGRWEVTVNGEVDPDGVGPATCGFRWGEGGTGQRVTGCEGTGTSENPLTGNAFLPVHTKLTGLLPGVEYVYRPEAANSFGVNLGSVSENREFTTPGPSIGEEWATNVTDESVDLSANVNPEEEANKPNEVSTSVSFEYGPSVAYGMSSDSRELNPDHSFTEARIPVSGLSAETTYHYRVAVTAQIEPDPESKPGMKEVVQFDGEDRTFRTQGESASIGGALPDRRQWELVTPPDKHGGLVLGLNQVGFLGPTQSSASGSTVTFGSEEPTEESPPGNGTFRIQVLAEHEDKGWESHDISLPIEEKTGLVQTPDYLLFSENLCYGVVPSLGSNAPILVPGVHEKLPYFWNRCECPSYPEKSCYEPLVTSTSDGMPVDADGEIKIFGATTDANHIVFSTSSDLLGLHAPNSQLYEWSRDRPSDSRRELISMLPVSDGSGPSTGGGTIGNNRGATLESGYSSILADGNRVVWAYGAGESELFLTDLARKESVRLDVPVVGAAGGVPEAMFEFASSDGSIIYFKDSARLTVDSSKSGSDLYECRVIEEAGSLGCVLSDVTPETDHERSEVQNVVLGGSSDGGTVYFVANAVLAPGASLGSCKEKATVSGSCNLYVYRDGAIRFIASLGGEDEFDWGGDNEAFRSFGTLTARVSGNGRFVLFMSDRSLTGYDNRDAVSGMPDQEVFLYDDQTEKLVCVSCDPSGGRPVGFPVSAASPLSSVVTPVGTIFSHGSWVASDIPVGVSFGGFEGESLYQSRVLFDSGRVFFDSSDALVPGDVNGGLDVYEWEPVGVGDCSEGSQGFSSSTGGCVSLVSSGRGLGGAGLLDASASGDDVFFVSSDSLVPRDVDTALDVYDAHVCGVGWECVSEPAVGEACSSADSCRAASPGLPGVFGAPPSATFKGEGNAATVKAPAKPQNKSLSRAVRLRRALVACRKRRRGRERSVCERSARKKYGAKPKPKGKGKSKPKSKSKKSGKSGKSGVFVRVKGVRVRGASVGVVGGGF